MLPARVDVPTAVKFLLWLAGVQTPGKLLVRAFRRDMRVVLRTVWLDNRDPKLASKIERWLRRWAKGERTILYGVNAFCREDAKAEFVLQSRLAHVDADDVELPPPARSQRSSSRAAPLELIFSTSSTSSFRVPKLTTSIEHWLERSVATAAIAAPSSSGYRARSTSSLNTSPRRS